MYPTHPSTRSRRRPRVRLSAAARRTAAAGVALAMAAVPAAASAHATAHHATHHGARHAVHHTKVHTRRHGRVQAHRVTYTARRDAIATTALTTAWTKPALVNPQTITLSPTSENLKLNQSVDYILACPSDKVTLPSAINIWGGHNLVFENCAVTITGTDWGGHFKNQTGTLWLHNIHFGGASLTGGIQLQEPNGTVVMRDVLFDTVRGSYTTNHAECVQTWSGPARLLIDGLTCPTTYQGLFLLPNQWDSTTHETVWDLRNVNVRATGAYALWLGDVQPGQMGSIPTWNVQNVYVSGPGEARDYDGSSDGGAAWRNVITGDPAGGDFVTATSTGATGPDETTTPAALPGE